jgi:hypothetical protein
MFVSDMNERVGTGYDLACLVCERERETGRQRETERGRERGGEGERGGGGEREGIYHGLLKRTSSDIAYE